MTRQPSTVRSSTTTAASVNVDVLIVVGTTLDVQPATYSATDMGAQCVFVVDPEPPPGHWLYNEGRAIMQIRKPATEGIAEVVALLTREREQRDLADGLGAHAHVPREP